MILPFLKLVYGQSNKRTDMFGYSADDIVVIHGTGVYGISGRGIVEYKCPFKGGYTRNYQDAIICKFCWIGKQQMQTGAILSHGHCRQQECILLWEVKVLLANYWMQCVKETHELRHLSPIICGLFEYRELVNILFSIPQKTFVLLFHFRYVIQWFV